ncbi:MAG: type III pantothenate kinase [Gemmatimonadetes bacterium]|nr:type III pantothenate kinase [Gemmatimonadota bacterium]
MILAVDVGNTETVIGLFEVGGLLDHWRISTNAERTVDELGLLLRSLIRESGFNTEVIRAAAIASVAPPLTPVLVESCERHLGLRTAVIDARSPLPIRLDVEEPLTVGADRIVNTLAAAKLYQTDTIAVDLGTATTFDCITSEGVFAGGVIAPGLRTGAETLVRRTAKLPRVDLERPERVIGRRTEASLQSGIFYAAVDAIDGIVRRIKTEWERPDALVVATGGLAPLIAPHCATVQRVEPFLTLYGLDLAYRHLEEQQVGLRVAPLKAPAAARRPR